MYPLRVKVLFARQRIKILQNLRANSGCGVGSHNTKMVTTVADSYIQALFDLPKVFVELAAKVCQYTVVSGLQQEFPGFNCSVQDLKVSVLTPCSGRLGRNTQSPAQGIGQRLGNDHIDKVADDRVIGLEIDPAVVFGLACHFTAIFQ